MKSFSFLLLVSKWSFFFWAFSSTFIAWFFTSCVREAISWSWTQEAKMSSQQRNFIQSRQIRGITVTTLHLEKMFQHLSGHALQLLIGSSQTVTDVPGMIQSCYRRAHCPVASLSSTYVIALIVSATGTTALAVRATAIDTGVAMTTTYLEGARVSHEMIGSIKKRNKFKNNWKQCGNSIKYSLN